MAIIFGCGYRPFKIFILFLYGIGNVVCQVLELDDSFLEKKADHSWLVKFYAPWCGHCRKLEPVYHQVSLDLGDTAIYVAKLDATKFPAIAAHFEIHGYPSILLIQGDRVFIYRGERSVEGISQFARRAHGPPVRIISNTGRFTDVRSEHANQVWFLYVGSLTDENSFYDDYKEIAEKLSILSFFYAIDPRSLPEDISLKNTPGLLVFKDKTQYEYIASEFPDENRQNLEKWINGERYELFPKISAGHLNELTEIRKRVVIGIVSTKKSSNYASSERLKSVLAKIAKENREEFHENYQFAWSEDIDTMEQLMMSHLNLPEIIVLEPSTHHYFLPDFPVKDVTMAKFVNFLREIIDGKHSRYGGLSWIQSMKRVFFDIYWTMHSIYTASAWLALVVFGIPSIVVVILFYALCCMEPIEDLETEAEWMRKHGGSEESKSAGDSEEAEHQMNHEKAE